MPDIGYTGFKGRSIKVDGEIVGLRVPWGWSTKDGKPHRLVDDAGDVVLQASDDGALEASDIDLAVIERAAELHMALEGLWISIALHFGPDFEPSTDEEQEIYDQAVVTHNLLAELADKQSPTL